MALHESMQVHVQLCECVCVYASVTVCVCVSVSALSKPGTWMQTVKWPGNCGQSVNMRPFKMRLAMQQAYATSKGRRGEGSCMASGCATTTQSGSHFGCGFFGAAHSKIYHTLWFHYVWALQFRALQFALPELLI